MFKPGDKILCYKLLDEHNTGHGYINPILGRVYTVDKYEGSQQPWVHMERLDDGPNNFSAKHFMLVHEASSFIKALYGIP